MRKKEEAITIVSLVVTILILIILASITICLTLGENGALEKAESTKKQHNITRITRELDIKELEAAVNNNSKREITKFIQKLLDDRIIEEKDILDEYNVKDGKCYIRVEEDYLFLIEENQKENDLEITYVEEVFVIRLNTDYTSNSIDVEVVDLYDLIGKELNSLGIEGAEYEYYIRKDGEDYGEAVAITNNNHYKYENLEQNQRYRIKVKANKDGKKGEIERWITTIKVPTPTIAVENANIWTTSKRVTISNISGYIVKYTLDGSIPSATNGTTYTGEFRVNNNNTVVTAVYMDSTNQIGSAATNTVSKIDKEKPVITSVTANTNTITLSAKDTLSGIIGYTITENTTIPTNFTNCNNTKNLNISIGNKKQGTTYYIWVKDLAGNISEYKQVETTRVASLTNANTTFTYNPSGWTRGNVVATASTTVSGFILQTSKDGINWSNTTSQTYSTNGIVYARLVDNIGQEGGTTTGNVDKIDKEKPVITSATANTNTINIKATDVGSGIVGYTITTNTTTPTSFTSCTNTKSLNVNVGNRKQGTTYYVWVKDLVGNISNYKQVGTTTVTNLNNANATFTYNPSGWTRGNVVATASTTVSGFTLQTSKDGVNWSNSASQTYSTNGIVYARLIDSTGQEGGSTTGNVTNIDKTPPTKPTINLNGYSSGSWTTGNVTITASSTDTQSGVAYYQYSHDGVNVVGNMPNPWVINWDGQWNFYVRAVDKVGNISEWSNVFTVRRDGTIPTEATISFNGSKIQMKLPIELGATVALKDGLSGVNTTACRYVINKNSGAIGTNPGSYTLGAFSHNQEGIIIQPNSVGNWYLHVLTIDNAGNRKETIKGPIIVSNKYHVHVGNSSTGGGCYNSPVPHTHNTSCYATCDGRLYYVRQSKLHEGEYTCRKCSRTFHLGNGGNPEQWDNSQCRYSELICKKTEGEIERYNLSCGKTTSTIEGYIVSY